MSGRDLVRGVRDTAVLPDNNSRRRGVVDLVLTAAALLAVGSFAYFGYITWLAPLVRRYL